MPVERSWSSLVEVLKAFWTPLEGSWTKLPDSLNIIDFHCFFQWISLIFQVPGGALEGSVGSWRSLGGLLRPLVSFLKALGSS